MLTAAVCAGADAEGDGEVRYYQGMHDVAAVLLFELGERPAYVLLHRLARCQLRDCTRCAEHACCTIRPLHDVLPKGQGQPTAHFAAATCIARWPFVFCLVLTSNPLCCLVSHGGAA